MPACKPVSVPLRAIAIHPDHASLHGSSDLPGSITKRAASPPLFGLAPRGVYPAGRIAPSAVRSYRTISPLPDRVYRSRRYIFCGTFRKNSFERSPPAVSRHAALWRPDFPLAFSSQRLSVRHLPAYMVPSPICCAAFALVFALICTTLVAVEPNAATKRWWSHVVALSGDDLQGRDCGERRL